MSKMLTMTKTYRRVNRPTALRCLHHKHPPLRLGNQHKTFLLLLLHRRLYPVYTLIRAVSEASPPLDYANDLQHILLITLKPYVVFILSPNDKCVLFLHRSYQIFPFDPSRNQKRCNSSPPRTRRLRRANRSPARSCRTEFRRPSA